MSNLDVKKQSVAEITENFKGAESAVVVDYRGLDVAEITALRKELRDNNVTYKVYKNTMVKRAVADAELEGLNDILDRKSTRLNSSHVAISYAVFCLKQK